MARFLILRRELAANAIDVIAHDYAEMLTEIQAVKSGDGAGLDQVRWSAMTPEWQFEAGGVPKKYKAQRIILELQARCDYTDRTLDEKFALMLRVLEDFVARDCLDQNLTSSEADGIAVDTVTPEAGSEGPEGNDFVVSYRVQCLVRSK